MGGMRPCAAVDAAYTPPATSRRRRPRQADLGGVCVGSGQKAIHRPNIARPRAMARPALWTGAKPRDRQGPAISGGFRAPRPGAAECQAPPSACRQRHARHARPSTPRRPARHRIRTLALLVGDRPHRRLNLAIARCALRKLKLRFLGILSRAPQGHAGHAPRPAAGSAAWAV